jgi:CRISPR-associated protein (TIGR03984 family)
VSKSETVYDYSKINSKCEAEPIDMSAKNGSYDDLNSYIEEKVKDIGSENNLVVAYLDYKVLIGRFDDGLNFCNGETFELKHLQRLRVFNSTGELLLIKEKPCVFNARVRIDGSGDDIEVIDANQVLWGTRAVKYNSSGDNIPAGWVCITEDRGTSLTLPLPNDIDVVQVNDKDRRVKLKTRNYISYNELGQAGFIDCRFMGILFPKLNERG